MSYLLAAYGVTLVALGLYGIHLTRERRRLSRELERADGEPPPGPTESKIG